MDGICIFTVDFNESHRVESLFYLAYLKLVIPRRHRSDGVALQGHIGQTVLRIEGGLYCEPKCTGRIIGGTTVVMFKEDLRRLLPGMALKGAQAFVEASKLVRVAVLDA